MSGTHQWIVVADARTATMIRCRVTPGREWHLEPVASITNAHEREHAHARPTELSGHGRGSHAHGAPHMSSPGHADEEEQRRFALEIAGREGWLARMIREHDAAHVHLFAPAPFLGILRTLVPDAGRGAAAPLPGPITLLEGELTRLTPGELAAHPKIVRALGTPAI